MSLEQLKKIRKQRMERIYIELQLCKQKYKDSKDELLLGKSRLEEFHHWRLKHQEELFDGLQSDFFSPDDLSKYMMKLDSLKEEEINLEQKIPTLEKDVEVAKAELFDAKKQLERVNRELAKVNEFIDIERKEEKKTQERKEDESMDELSSSRHR